MTLTRLSITIWHDLAAPTLVGIAAGPVLEAGGIAGSNVKWARLAAAWQHAPHEETGPGRPLAFAGLEVVTHDGSRPSHGRFRAEIAVAPIRLRAILPLSALWK